MDLSIVIINYKCADFTLNCLKSVFEFTRGISFEVIVVDNDSKDDSKKRIVGSYPQIKWIEMACNAGFSRANNAGMKEAQGRHILLLNADTLVFDDVISRCFHRLETNPDIAAIGGIQLYEDKSPMPFYRSFAEIRRTFFILPNKPFFQQILHKTIPETLYADPNQVDWLVAAFLMVKGETIEKAGKMDEDFFLYGEDVEWSGRLGKAGKLCYFDDIRFIHLENKNPFRRENISWVNRFSVQMQVSNFLWVRKQYGIAAYLVLIIHYLTLAPMFFLWKIIVNLKNFRNPFFQLENQLIFARKTKVILKYFFKTIFKMKYFYKISPHENIK